MDNEIIEKCIFCEHSTPLWGDKNVICSKKGVVLGEFCCKKFSYDPLKREPLPPPALPKLEKIDDDDTEI